MCFHVDYDWYPSINEIEERPAPKDIRCGECRAVIPAGEIAKHIYLQEYEECQECGEYEGDGACTGGCVFGEKFETWQCLPCARFLEAVDAAEIDAGCDETESLPPYNQMREYIRDGGKAEAVKYAKKAVAMYPDLRRHVGYLWRIMWGK